jgi:hypothetical protein
MPRGFGGPEEVAPDRFINKARSSIYKLESVGEAAQAAITKRNGDYPIVLDSLSEETNAAKSRCWKPLSSS